MSDWTVSWTRGIYNPEWTAMLKTVLMGDTIRAYIWYMYMIHMIIYIVLKRTTIFLKPVLKEK